jgi:outer membrane receptor for ferrienterochelin and colicin
VTDVYTVVGQTFSLPIELSAAETGADQGAPIIVTATRIKGAGNLSAGPVTVLTSEQISKVASVNRDIRDLAARNPFATLDTSSTNGRQVSFAGQNPRFNRFTIDGVPITDSFGLNPDALPSAAVRCRWIRSASSKPRSRPMTFAKASSRAASATRS